MTKFSEREYDLQITKFEFEISECNNQYELQNKKEEIKAYINEFKLLHFRWKLEEDYFNLKELINEKLNEIKYVKYKSVI